MASKEEILINVTPRETRVAVVENGVLQELHIERTLSRGLVGSIYKGKVVRVLPGMQAAFVDIGLDKNGFLHAADIARNDPAFSGAAMRDIPPIQELVHEGKHIYVQVLKDPIGSKGARLTTELSMPSRNLVYLPNGNEIGISQKIECADERERLRDVVQRQIEQHDLTGGFIIRTLAESVTEADIANDMLFQQRLWLHVSSKLKGAQPATLIHEDVPLSLRTMRDLVHDHVEKIRIDSRESYEKARDFARDFMPELVDKLEYYPGEQPLFGLYSIEQEIENAMQRKVKLKSGGDLIIDQTEAMTTIDVNTGSYVGRHSQEETLFKTNLEAATEIAHQLRLRNLGGIIIVDFIDMQSQNHKKQVLAALDAVFAKDRVKINITDISPLGLVEITRKRTRESLEQILCEACPTCEGRGTVKTIQTVCYEILREILREDRQYKAQAYTIVAAPRVVELLLDEEASSLADLQEFIDRPISLQADPLLSQQDYDIALA
ncbi:ribonuclease G [Arenicella xantha]|uniref:Ribonuclease G n=1 Tax=Arenicella xantha TaxID=644221 RepID=A0A395JNR7_9GAMM|nr:ribonuclease G [Arenicella xantha]RBP53249.1 RNAse G [Arenicella xantha]